MPIAVWDETTEELDEEKSRIVECDELELKLQETIGNEPLITLG